MIVSYYYFKLSSELFVECNHSNRFESLFKEFQLIIAMLSLLTQSMQTICRCVLCVLCGCVCCVCYGDVCVVCVLCVCVLCVCVCVCVCVVCVCVLSQASV